jgi:hypothetical protein
MPKNTAGGNKAKGMRNSESAKAGRNRRTIEDLFADCSNGESLKDIVIGRCTKKYGHGRMEVFFMDETPKTGPQPVMQNIPLSGRLRGRGRKDVWVDIDSIVLVARTEFTGDHAYEIIAVIPPDYHRDLRRLRPDLDPRIFEKGGSASTESKEGGFEFEGGESESESDPEKDVDVDAI